MISATELRELLEYDPVTGKLHWKVRPIKYFPSRRTMKAWNTRYAGAAAFDQVGPRNTRNGQVHAKTYPAHRIIWCMVYGYWPENDVVHVNKLPYDNRLDNLSLAETSSKQRCYQ